MFPKYSFMFIGTKFEKNSLYFRVWYAVKHVYSSSEITEADKLCNLIWWFYDFREKCDISVMLFYDLTLCAKSRTTLL